MQHRVDLGMHLCLGRRISRQQQKRERQRVGGRFMTRGENRQALVAQLPVAHRTLIPFRIAGLQKQRQQILADPIGAGDLAA